MGRKLVKIRKAELKRLREEKGLTQEEVAASLYKLGGVSLRTYQKFESVNSTTHTFLQHMEDVAKVLQVDDVAAIAEMESKSKVVIAFPSTEQEFGQVVLITVLQHLRTLLDKLIQEQLSQKGADDK